MGDGAACNLCICSASLNTFFVTLGLGAPKAAAKTDASAADSSSAVLVSAAVPCSADSYGVVFYVLLCPLLRSLLLWRLPTES